MSFVAQKAKALQSLATPTCVGALVVLFGVGPPGPSGPLGLVPLPWPPRCCPPALVFTPLIGAGRVYPPPGGLPGKLEQEKSLMWSI